LVVPEAEDVITVPLQVGGAQGVMFAGGRGVVDATVQFDHEPQFVAVEVKDVRPDCVLSPELQTGAAPGAQGGPEPLFGLGLPLP
jgi:hypothetical protein